MIGIDEVGRGCWAGPLLVVAARAKAGLPIGLKDSKKLTKKQRESLMAPLQQACELGEGWVQAAEIDRFGLAESMRLAVARALQAIKALPEEQIIMDGTFNYCAAEYQKVTCVAKADSSYPIVSAASIYAKVTRDEAMVRLDAEYPGYGFAAHVGYGTTAHIKALQLYGPTDIHRLSYKPVKSL